MQKDGENMQPLRQSKPGTVLQVAHVVRDIEASVHDWVRTQGAGPFFGAQMQFDGHTYRGQPHRVNLHIAVGCLGSTIIELAQPADDAPSLFSEVLAQRGPGLHHYWIHSNDFDATLARYAQSGCPYVGGGPLPGIGRGAYVDTTSLLGCFVELLEMNDRIWEFLEQFRTAHQGWRGERPLRPYPAL